MTNTYQLHIIDDVRCPACGDIIDYCQGHGEIGDPWGATILNQHDGGDHSGCHPDGCDVADGFIED
jgi:hypothetical protein